MIIFAAVSPVGSAASRGVGVGGSRSVATRVLRLHRHHLVRGSLAVAARSLRAARGCQRAARGGGGGSCSVAKRVLLLRRRRQGRGSVATRGVRAAR